MTIARNAFYIGGEWVAPASTKRFNLINAGTEELIGSVPEGVEADVDRAVAAARHAFDHSGWSTCCWAPRWPAGGWPNSTAQERGPCRWSC